MKKLRHKKTWFLNIALLTAFISLHVITDFSVLRTSSSCTSGFIVQTGFFSSDAGNEIPDPWSEPDENTELETDSSTESLAEFNHINYQLFFFSKKGNSHYSDELLPYHSELISPPPES